MNTQFSETQIQIVTDLLIDNGMLYKEAKDSICTLDANFTLRIVSIKDYCYQLYMDVLNGELDVELVLNKITHLLNKIAQYKDSYAKMNNVFGELAFRHMNSFFDKTSETFEEFFNTL